MNKFDYGDVVRVVGEAPANLRPGQKAWIVGVFNERQGKYFEQFPEGTVYSIEYEDGSSLEVHENYLSPFELAGKGG